MGVSVAPVRLGLWPPRSHQTGAAKETGKRGQPDDPAWILRMRCNSKALPQRAIDPPRKVDSTRSALPFSTSRGFLDRRATNLRRQEDISTEGEPVRLNRWLLSFLLCYLSLYLVVSRPLRERYGPVLLVFCHHFYVVLDIGAGDLHWLGLCDQSQIAFWTN
jgi:hypothetical protein